MFWRKPGLKNPSRGVCYLITQCDSVIRVCIDAAELLRIVDTAVGGQIYHHFNPLSTALPYVGVKYSNYKRFVPKTALGS